MMRKDFVLLCCALALLSACESAEPIGEVEQLYLAASTAQGGGVVGADAVRRLGAKSDPRVDGLLLRLALGRAGRADSIVSTAAVQQLAERGATEAAEDLAMLLTPSEHAGTRQAVAEALLTLGCPGSCVPSVLEYLHRIHQGEFNGEEGVFVRSGERTELVAPARAVLSAMREQQRQIYDRLYEVLRRQPDDTVAALSESYGLGGDAPSAFALDLVMALRLREACPELLKTRAAPGLAAAFAAANCRN